MSIMIPETTTPDGAQYLKDRITAYWRGRGYRGPDIYIQRAHSPRESTARYDVRSNMVGGWPLAGPAR